MTLLAVLLIGCSGKDDDSASQPTVTDTDTDTDADTDSDADTDTDMSFRISSTSFADGAAIPQDYSCDSLVHAQGKSPQLSWSNPPVGTEYFAITVFDPDAFDTPHWGVFDLPAATTSLADGLRPDSPLPGSAWEAIVYTGAAQYAGPCPPAAHNAHSYVFTVYALDELMPLYATTPRLEDLQADVADRMLGSAQTTGTYDR